MSLENVEGQESQTGSEGVTESTTPESNPSPQEQQGAQETAPQQKDTEKYVPYDRFQEVIAQKNQEAQLARELSNKYAQLEGRFQEIQARLTPKQEDALLVEMKKHNPEFASRFEQMTTKLAKFDELEKRLQSYDDRFQQGDMQSFKKDAVSTIQALHSENKVTPELVNLYNSQLDLRYRSGELKNIDDVRSAYKQVHDTYTKLIDGITRSTTQKYAQVKKEDTKAPTSQSKGKPAVAKGKDEWAKDPEAARAQIVKKYLASRSVEKDI